MSRYPEFDPSRIHPQCFSRRQSKVRAEQFAGVPKSGATFAEFLASFPRIFAGEEIRAVASRIAHARRRGRAVVAACGGHVVKCGLTPMLIALMERRLLTAVAVNGAFAIHDLEIALFGKTSEDVSRGLETGSFGMATETASAYNSAIREAHEEGLGAGEAIGRLLAERDGPYNDKSLLAAGYRLGIPVTVHIALGTDIVHMHPSAEGAALGDASLRDFRILTAAMRDLTDEGVLLNIGSAVLLPEVLLKAIALLRNESDLFSTFFGVNLDFIQQYRSNAQVVTRVKAIGGDGTALTGHHEIMIPLLTFAILEEWEKEQPDG